MFRTISQWVEKQRAVGRVRREDAQRLLTMNRTTAYYDAHRLAARARFAGDRRSFMHWAGVAAEIARIGDCSMDIKLVQAIVEEEERLCRPRSRT